MEKFILTDRKISCFDFQNRNGKMLTQEKQSFSASRKLKIFAESKRSNSRFGSLISIKKFVLPKRSHSRVDFPNNKERMLKSTRSQIWGLDVMVAVIIFLIGLIVIYLYALNFLGESKDILDNLFYQGNFASSLILSEGSPENWTQDDADIPGILTNSKINQTKLNNFYLLSQTEENYKQLKKMLELSDEFYFNFSEMEISGIGSINGIGKQIENPQNLIRIERFAVYKEKPVKFVIYIWN